MQVSPRLQKSFSLLLEVGTGILISLLILAILPLLIQKVSQHTHKRFLDMSRLVPLMQDQILTPDDPPEPELPEPPEPEIDPPTPPELEPPDMLPAEVNESVSEEIPAISLRVEIPTLTAGGVSIAVKMGAPHFKRHLAPPRVAPPAFNGKRVFDMKEVDKQPQYLSPMQPPYPYKARRMGIEGYVDVRFLVDKNGLPHKLTILEARPKGEFEDAVKKTVPHWKFKPGQKNGRAVDTWVKTRILFKLN